MYGSLRGKVIEIQPTSFLLEVGGVGYKVIAPPSILSALKNGDEAFVYLHDHVREDNRDLYGFLTSGDLALFERLISINGVGPKVAMAILSVGSAETVRRAIMAGDLETLTSVPGVGKKTAQKIILELKGELVETQKETPEDRDAVQALQSLGYGAQEAREALKAVAPEVKEVSARVREALKMMGKR